MRQEECNTIKIGDKVKFHCFDGSTIDVEVTEINDGLVYGKSQLGSHWADIKDVEIINNKLCHKNTINYY